MSQINVLQIDEMTLDQLQTYFENEGITSSELVKYYLKRIALYDQSGPTINSILEINPEALFIARSLDTERKNRVIRGPLHGVPVLLKYNIDTGDQMHTSAGSIALENHYAKKDAYIVKKLRDAGAVILGKANMTEWANFMAYNMPNGYSSRGGQVLNPYGPGELDVSGSSSGSGAAVACNFTMLAVGTETSGSILCPAGNNNIVGIKPTVGLVSRTGIIPISFSQDTAGPMARNVKDAAILLEILTGYDPEDSATHSAPPVVSYMEGLPHASLKGKRLGVAYDFCIKNLSEIQKSVFDQALFDLSKAGAEIVHLDQISPVEKKNSIDYHVLLHEFKSGINHYLKTVSPSLGLQTLSDIIAFNEKNKAGCLKYNQELLIESNKTGGTLTSPDYINSRLNDLEHTQNNGIDLVMHENQLDALISPNDVWYGIPAKAGYPSISVPSGFDKNGMPLSIIFTAEAFSEKKLIEFAYVYEKSTQMRKPIKFS
ncbi:amidase family protein [Fictibacillus phosphorivorans]|uniref:amidase family protein n=1 Tax=Fictibacillus phosphorivorans TaxID=1221500 RepID=UPI0020413274|nr:amidase family protein [Fictibacillus phosphorivorans]MCM3719647.1 amidase family protein [Fictibacillus phosphorivorans]MCM3777279.1 amidase family protein [Fictibacillus phosphorivorans]